MDQELDIPRHRRSTRKPRQACIVLVLDSLDRHGFAGADPADPEALARIVADVRARWPRQRVCVSRCVPGTEWTASTPAPMAGDVDALATPFFTDAKRLRALALPRHALMAVLRPAALLLPTGVCRVAVESARDAGLDLATVDGVPSDVFYVASPRALGMAEAAGAAAGAATVPHAIERLRRLGLSVREAPLAAARLSANDVGWRDRALADALAPSAWKEWPSISLLDLDSPSRLAAAVLAQAEHLARDRALLQRARGPVTRDGTDRRSVLVTVPAMYQSGANAAWEEILRQLPRDDVAFVCGRGTALRHRLDARGFRIWQTTDGMAARSARDAAVFLEALDTVRPEVIHFDGAEGSTWAPVAFARGARIVQHVRLNDLDRFQPAFAFADAIVAVAPHLQARIAARLGRSARVEHIADGIDLQAHRPGARGQSTGGRVRCLCVGRVEPEKGTRQVLDIARALSARVPCDLLVVGSCGNDPAYCDAFTADILAAVPPLTATWRSFTQPIHDLYADAHVVLAASRNEALGMVGLEALAAGCLLVARRSAGYECIVDESRGEGLLFEGHDAPSAIAARIVEALAERQRFAVNGRRKVETAFDAHASAARLLALWRDLRPSS